MAQRYLVTVGGNDGRQALDDVWALDTAAKPLLKLRDQFAARDDFGFNVQVGTATTFVVGGGWRKVPPR